MSNDLIINPYKSKPDISLVGRKCLGLQNLVRPSKWTPPFIVVTTKAHKRWLQEHISEQVAEISTDHWLFSEGRLKEYIDFLRSGPTVSLIVRSSAVFETLHDRGRYKSKICQSTPEAVIKAVFDIWLDACERFGASVDSIALIIQIYRQPKASGHLSNERRVSRRSTDWVVEIETGLNRPVTINRFSTRRSPTTPTSRVSFSCTKLTDVEHILKSIASDSSETNKRCHYEWIWDGEKIWIVQKDLEDAIKGTAPGCLSQHVGTPSSVSSNIDPLDAFVKEVDAVGNWNKIKSVREFRQCGIPTASVYVLEDARFLADLANGNVNLAVSSDLQRLLQLPIVIRTDIKLKTGISNLLRPKTDCVHNITEAINFITKTAKQFLEEGLTCNEFCFIAHRFIAARACALSLSRPGISRVRIDSTWGLPDSLQFYPHDSFEVDVRNANSIKKRIRCKTEYIDVNSKGEWIEKSSGVPYDWKVSLTSNELTEIANFTHQLSGCLKEPVEVMFLVGIDVGTGHPPCLPWYSTTKDLPDYDQDGEIRLASHRIYISDKSDLEKLKGQLEGENIQGTTSIRLKPKPELLRSSEASSNFIEDVAKLACRFKLPIELEGSILSHAYYIISREGVKVRCIDPFEPKLIRQKFGKLVRDLIPIKIESQGEFAASYKVTVDQLIPLLKAKAVEEALELYWENDSNKSFEELADLLEVIISICETYGRTLDELKTTAEAKRAERGGFKEGLVLVETRETPLINRESKELALFENAASSNVKNDKEIVTRLIRLDDRKPRQRGKNVVIPLIPPASIKGMEKIVIPTSESQELVITYMHKEILLSLQVASKHENEDSTASLFDEN